MSLLSILNIYLTCPLSIYWFWLLSKGRFPGPWLYGVSGLLLASSGYLLFEFYAEEDDFLRRAKEVDGKVVKYKVERIADSDKYYIAVVYRYRVGDRTYEKESDLPLGPEAERQIRVFSNSVEAKRWAGDMVDLEKPLLVRYDPNNPERATLFRALAIPSGEMNRPSRQIIPILSALTLVMIAVMDLISRAAEKRKRTFGDSHGT